MPETLADDAGNLRFRALALQVRTASVGQLPDRLTARTQVQRNLRRLAGLVQGSVRFIRQFSGDDVRLVVLPEYSLTGAPSRGSFRDWRALAAFEVDGPEYQQLGQIAADNQLYLAGNAYEADAGFPDYYFQTSFVIDPAGCVILRYRRMISLYSPSPYDFWDRYLDRYGAEAVFPVVDTPIGRIAAIASEEILFPEIARCMVLRGAEILLHSTSEMGSPRPTTKELARRARAAENLAYLISANTAGVDHTPLPGESSTGLSKIVDYEGRIIAEALPGGESLVANAILDIGALRSRRRRPGLANTVARLPLTAFAGMYRATLCRLPNELASARDSTRDDLMRIQAETIERLAAARLI